MVDLWQRQQQHSTLLRVIGSIVPSLVGGGELKACSIVRGGGEEREWAMIIIQTAPHARNSSAQTFLLVMISSASARCSSRRA